MDLNIDVNQSLNSQGWTPGPYFSGGYSNVGGTLNWNTIGMGIGPFLGISYFERGLPVHDANLPWQLTWEVRINDDESTVPPYWAGAYTFISLGGKGVGIGFDRDNLSVFNADGNPWSNSLISYSADWRTFLVDADPVSGAFTLKIDTVTVYQGIMDAYLPTGLYLGDGTNGSNVDANTRKWHLTQLAAVPASDSALLLLVMGIGALAGIRRSMRSIFGTTFD
jgi:hypothetical protein